MTNFRHGSLQMDPIYMYMPSKFQVRKCIFCERYHGSKHYVEKNYFLNSWSDTCLSSLNKSSQNAPLLQVSILNYMIYFKALLS